MKQVIIWITCIAFCIMLLEVACTYSSHQKTCICESCSSVRFDTSQERADSLFNVLNCGYYPFASFKIDSENYVSFDSVYCRKLLLLNGNDSVIVLEPIYIDEYKDQQFVKIETPCFLDEKATRLMKEDHSLFYAVNNTPFFYLNSGLFTYKFINSESFIILNIYTPACGTAAFYSDNYIIEKERFEKNLIFFNPVSEDDRVVLFLMDADTSANGNIIMERIALNPVLESQNDISEIKSQKCSRKVFRLGDTLWNFEHITYQDPHCFKNFQGQEIPDTFVLGTSSVDVQQIITDFAQGDLKKHYQETAINPRVMQLWQICSYGRNYMVIGFEDSNAVLTEAGDMFLLIYELTDQKVVYFGRHVESPNINAFFGDFNGDKVLDFVSWNFGEARIYTLGRSVRKPSNIKVEVENGQITDKYDLVFKTVRFGETYPDYEIFFNKGFYTPIDYRTW